MLYCSRAMFPPSVIVLALVVVIACEGGRDISCRYCGATIAFPEDLVTVHTHEVSYTTERNILGRHHDVQAFTNPHGTLLSLY
jgi:hypothetical protein